MTLSQRFAAASLVAAALTLPLSGVAQVQVVDSDNRLLGGKTVASSQRASDPIAEMYYQMQVLQQEVLELRGQVEEQAYELKRLKQQRLDDYVSLDRRLSGLASTEAASVGEGLPEQPGNIAGPVVDSGATKAEPLATMPAMPDADELQSYRTAIDLVLRQKDYDKAVLAFQDYLAQFPRGKYAPNSQYWLGEIFLLKGDLERAREWFARLLGMFPEHAKVADATFKLGTVYHKLGDNAKARELLQQVATGDTNASRLASNYLNNEMAGAP